MSRLLKSAALVLAFCFASSAIAEDLVEAKRHFDIAAKAYELGDYAKAIDAYKKSYAAARKPLLLYDLGQAYRKLGDLRQALHFYRQYLAVAPTGKYVVEAQQQVGALTDLVAKLEAARTAPPDGAGTDVADQEAAKALFGSASWHYGLNEYKQALEQFQEAYKLYPDPSVLFNIAQCQRQLGMRKEAVVSYRGFVKATNDSVKRADAVALIETIESALAAEAAQKSQEPTMTVTQPVVVASPPEKTPPKRRGWVIGVAVGSVVVIGVALGVGLGVGLRKNYYSPTEGKIEGN